MPAEVHAFDLVSGDPLGRLDVGQLRWSEELNARLTLECRLDLAHRPSAERVPFLLPGRTKLVLYDPPIVKSFLVREAIYLREDFRFGEQRHLYLRAAGLWSWFGQFPISRPFRFDQVEQHEIAATLIDWAQQPAQGGGIGVDTEHTPSGRLRDRLYNRWDYTPVGQRVDELAAVIDGFDFAIDTTFDGNVTVTETWRPSYPRAGRPWPASGIQLDADGTVASLEVLSAAPTTDMRALGMGEADDMLHAEAHDTSLAGYPPLWRQEPHKTVSRQTTLQSHAGRDLQLANRGVERWAATVLDKFDLLKSLTVGDECQIVISPGDFRYPDGLQVVRRVVGRTVNVSDDGGPDEVRLDLEVSDV